MARENYFILLDLDPTEEDPARIEAAIVGKQREWAGLRNHPSKGSWANLCLVQIPAIRRVMANAEQRKTEAEAAQLVVLNRQKEQFMELDRALETMASKGFILEVELEHLLKKEVFKVFSRNAVEDRIKVPIKKEDAPKEKIDPLDPSMAGQIERNLTIVGKTHLYDFLEMERTSLPSTLQKQADEKYRDARLVANKDAILTATLELLGICKTVFKNEETQKRYNKTLDQQRFSTLNNLIEYAGSDKEIASAEFEHLLKEGAKMGLDKDEIIAHVKQYAVDKKWAVQLPDAGSPILQSLACGVCGTLNIPQAKACSHCGFPLSVDCPRCKTPNSSSVRNCSSCGYATGDMPNALPLLRDAKAALAEGEYVQAEKLFNLANTYWENHPDVLAGRQKIREQSDLAQLARKKVQDFIQKSEYYQARTALAELKALPSGIAFAASLEADISEKIAATERLLAKARAAGTTRDKEQAYAEALHFCRDCGEASESLERIPPDVPGALTTSIQDQSVFLQWQPTPSAMQIVYRIVRKAQSLPTHPGDGETLVETPQLSFLDKNGQAGLTYYYAVFAKRGAVFSSKAVFSEPVIKVAEVGNLQAVPADGSLILRWQTPAHALRIEVWTKKNTPPAYRGEGALLLSIRHDGASHDGLVNGETQGYRVVAIYKDPFGKELPSPGIPIHAAASAPPKPIEQLSVQKTGNLVELEWREGVDKVEIFAAPQPFSFKPEEMFSYAQLGTMGTQVPVHQKGKASLRLSRHGIQYLLPVTVKGPLAVAAHAVAVCHLEEVSDLSYRMEAGKLQLSWVFPPGAQKAEVYCGDSFGTNRGSRHMVLESEYRRSGSFTLGNLPPDLPEVLIRVRTMIEMPEGTIEYSQGQEKTVKIKKTSIRFYIQKNGFSSIFSSSVKFDLKLEVDGWLDVPFQLVVKENNRLISFKDPDRILLRDFAISDFMSAKSLQTAFTYKPTGKGVKNLFFSLIPTHQDDKDSLQIEDNGKKIVL